MKYKILPAKKLQCGDVIFTSSGETLICARVLGQNLPSPQKGVAEYRVEVIDGIEGTNEGHTTLRFSANDEVGVSREDEAAEVDVAALLASLDDE